MAFEISCVVKLLPSYLANAANWFLKSLISSCCFLMSASIFFIWSEIVPAISTIVRLELYFLWSQVKVLRKSNGETKGHDYIFCATHSFSCRSRRKSSWPCLAQWQSSPFSSLWSPYRPRPCFQRGQHSLWLNHFILLSSYWVEHQRRCRTPF